MKKTKDMSLTELKAEARAIEERLMVITFLIYLKEGTTYSDIKKQLDKKPLK